jgi:hypothetical protein
MPKEEVRARKVAAWLQNAVADAERRGLPDLRPLLENLAQATAFLRSADWNDDASGGSENETDLRKGA